MTSSQHRFFNTPECWQILSHSLSKTDLASLACSSRVCYRNAIPELWGEVRGVHHLFALLPGAKVKKAGYKKKTIKIPDLSTCDFTRFNVYSPLVKSLDIIESPYHTYGFTGWSKLASYTRHATLLPNLQDLAFGCDRSRDDTYINWIATFLSPSVLKIDTYNVDFFNHSNLSFAFVHGFIQLVTDRCPSLSALSFFPTEDFLAHRRVDSEDEDVEVSRGESRKDPSGIANAARDFGRTWGVSLPEGRQRFLEPLGRAQHLRSLTSNAYILCGDVLQTLGSLPHLEQLTIFDEFAAYEELVYAYELPESSFPALRKLSLLILPNALIPHIWTITSLVRRLTSVTIRINGDEQEGNQHVEPFGDDEPTELVKFLPTLCEGSPNLEELFFDLDAIFGGNSMGVVVSTAKAIPSVSLQALARLSLRKLDLRVVKLHPMSRMCETLASCTTLRELYLQHEPVTFADLMHFTKLPSLECLQVSISWGSIATLDACLQTVENTSPAFLCLQCSRAPPKKLSEQQINKLALYLVALWPNLFEVFYAPQTPYPLGHYPDPDFFPHLTACVRSLRQSASSD